MADHLIDALIDRGISVQRFDLTSTSLAEIAMALVDASTLLLGTPAVLNGVHPFAAHAAYVVNALKPKLKNVSLFGSYGWGPKALENPAAMLPNLNVEYLPPVLSKGALHEAEFKALDELADTIAAKHAAGA